MTVKINQPGDSTVATLVLPGTQRLLMLPVVDDEEVPVFQGHRMTLVHKQVDGGSTIYLYSAVIDPTKPATLP